MSTILKLTNKIKAYLSLVNTTIKTNFVQGVIE